MFAPVLGSSLLLGWFWLQSDKLQGPLWEIKSCLAPRKYTVYLETCLNFKLCKTLQPHLTSLAMFSFLLSFITNCIGNVLFSWEFAARVFYRGAIPSNRSLFPFSLQVWEQESRTHSIHSFIQYHLAHQYMTGSLLSCWTYKEEKQCSVVVTLFSLSLVHLLAVRTIICFWLISC